MPDLHIDRLDVRVTGLDPATVRAALPALPAALDAALGGDARPARLGPGAGPQEVARAIAERVVAQLRATRGERA